MRLALASLTLSVFAFAAAPADPAHGNRTSKWGKVTAGCRFSATARESSAEPGQPIYLDLELENAGNAPVHVMSAELFEMYRFRVCLPNGKDAPLTLEGQRRQLAGGFERSHFELRPGETTKGVVLLNRLFDMTLKGEYRVEVSRLVLPGIHDDAWMCVPCSELIVVVQDSPKADPPGPRGD